MNKDNKYNSIAFKKKLGQRINNVKGKKHLRNIFSIIHNEAYTKAETGLYFDLNVLSITTLKEIEEYLDEHFPIVDIMPIDNVIKSLSDNKSDTKDYYGMTNQEKNFLKKLDSDSLKKESVGIPSLN